MYKINGHYIYLTDSQYNDIFNKISVNETSMWKCLSHIIDTKENIEKHKRIKNYIQNNFKKEYYQFDFYGEDAHNNVENILGDYDSLSDAIDLIIADEFNFAEMLVPRKNYIENITIKIYEKNFLSWIFGRKYIGNSITINIKK